MRAGDPHEKPELLLLAMLIVEAPHGILYTATASTLQMIL
jgi:hypothetical protein